MKKLSRVALILLIAMVFTACSASSKKYVIVSDTTYPPFEWTDEKGNFVGIDVDIMKAIAEDQGFDVEIKGVGFTAALGEVESGQADGVIAGMTITDERKLKYDFSEPYYEVSVTMAVTKDSSITDYEGLRGKNVALKTSTNGATFAESIKDKYGFTVSYFTDSPTMYQDVVSGNSVACFEDRPVMEYSVANGVNLKVTSANEIPSNYGFGVLKGENADLLKKFNAGLANIKANGKYQEIVDKYTK